MMKPADPNPPQREMTPAEMQAHDSKLTKLYEREIKFSGMRATIARNHRIQAQSELRTLEARIQLSQVRGKLGELALQEGIDLEALAEKKRQQMQKSEDELNNSTQPSEG